MEKIEKIEKEKSFRLYDFNIYNKPDDNDKNANDDRAEDGSDNDMESDSSYNEHKKQDKNKFFIQMFGKNEKNETCSIIATGFKPFFYVKVADNWTIDMKNKFISHIQSKMGNYYEKSISIADCKLVKKKKLYGFDNGKEHKFILFVFHNVPALNKVKNYWYKQDSNKEMKLLYDGYMYQHTSTYLYESNIPPLLRFFHIKDISPSGWISLPNKKTIEIKNNKHTHCTYEYMIHYKDLIALNDKETSVPYKICSFDIEASSSHGDFPIPVKTYKKLATNVIEYFEKKNTDISTTELCKTSLTNILLYAFGFPTMAMDHIDIVYPKKSPTIDLLKAMIQQLFEFNLMNVAEKNNENTIECMFEKMQYNAEREAEREADADAEENAMEDAEVEEEFNEDDHVEKEKEKEKDKEKVNTIKKSKNVKKIIDMLCDKKTDRNEKITDLNNALNSIFPKLEGDKVTFIGSTFMINGQEEPYLNHCVVLNSCSPIPIEKSVIESYASEKEVLLAWKNIIQTENPDIIIGYNIFGFDYAFMFQRAEENNCVEEFLKLSKNKNEICGTKDYHTGKYKIEENKVQIASGLHEFKFIKINGRIQIDLYNFFRKEENLISYKLDYVSGYFIGDFVKDVVKEEKDNNNRVTIKSGNLTGLQVGSFIHFEEIGHTTSYYNDGEKFEIVSICKKEETFIILGPVNPDMTKKVRWCLAKDDLSYKDLFKMTNGTAQERAIVAKYCIQDCNLLHYLMKKKDILTGYTEMAKICSVPISFLVFRGQGIKLTSCVAKKCREKDTLMPVLEKLQYDDGYEGAIVLDPKCDLYMDNPVACVDYASLYPSSQMSENISQDSKVWTKEYNLQGILVSETGDTNDKGEFIYDNLPEYEYVDISYDTFKYVRKNPSSAAEKIKKGHKICRFAQFPAGKRAIMPSILEELLTARKTTRKKIPQEKDEFMKNVLDKRQLAYKLTANSLYGQCGARTSTFYDKDVAASTTATGRLLLTYAKKVIEECYGNNICHTEKYGPVVTKAEYIYGDTDSVFFTFNLETPEGELIRGKKALEITIELAQEAGHLASSFLKQPHDLEYEKTFMPFCLLSKKRYVGMLYEHDPTKGKRKEMGIVLKRRDNAPIVKDVYGGIIDILMKEKDIQKAIDFLKGCLKNMVDEKYPMDKLVISKSLRSGYKNPKQIAHKVLADRIMERDPGNKPSSGDRIPYVFIHNPNKKALQGEKIETPSFVKEHHLKIDYSFYITNQILKPVQQVFALVLEKIWKMQHKTGTIRKFQKMVDDLKKNTSDQHSFEEKLEDLRCKEIKVLLFDEFLRETNNHKNNVKSITTYFEKTATTTNAL